MEPTGLREREAHMPRVALRAANAPAGRLENPSMSHPCPGKPTPTHPYESLPSSLLS